MHAAAEVPITHELSVPGRRPLCGADEPADVAASGVQPVTCGACLRLLRDDVRRAAHHARPSAGDSED